MLAFLFQSFFNIFNLHEKKFDEHFDKKNTRNLNAVSAKNIIRLRKFYYALCQYLNQKCKSINKVSKSSVCSNKYFPYSFFNNPASTFYVCTRYFILKKCFRALYYA